MTIGVDAPAVEDEAEAETLFFHHLRLAAMYFEATGLGVHKRTPEHFAADAMRGFIHNLDSLYPED